MSVEKSSLEYMTEKTNKAVDTRQAIIYMVETDEKIQKKQRLATCKLKNEKKCWKIKSQVGT